MRYSSVPLAALRRSIISRTSPSEHVDEWLNVAAQQALPGKLALDLALERSG